MNMFSNADPQYMWVCILPPLNHTDLCLTSSLIHLSIILYALLFSPSSHLFNFSNFDLCVYNYLAV
jgi:hypothetical protein